MRGFCYLGPPEGFGGKRHLKIILTEPNSDGLVVIVSVTTLKHPETQASLCVLRKGDHPFIRHDSVVDVDRPEVKRAIDIINGLNNGELIRKEELEPAVFERVLNAAKSVRKMQPRIKAIQRADRALAMEAC